MGDPERGHDVLFDQQNREAFLIQSPHDAEHLLHDCRRQTERRLVEHDETRLPHQAAADRQHLLLAARQGSSRLFGALGEAREQAEHALQRRLLRGARPFQGSAHLEIFEHGQIGKHLAAFGDMADADLARPVARPAGDIDAVERDLARRGLLDAMDGADQRAFARTVRAHDGHDLAGGDLDRHAGQRLGVAIVEVDAVDLEKGGTHAGSSSPRYTSRTA